MALKINEHPILPGVSAGIRSADVQHQGHFELCWVRVPVLGVYPEGLHSPSTCPALPWLWGPLRSPLVPKVLSKGRNELCRQTRSSWDRASAQPKFLPCPTAHRAAFRDPWEWGSGPLGMGIKHTQNPSRARAWPLHHPPPTLQGLGPLRMRISTPRTPAGPGHGHCITHPAQGQTGHSASHEGTRREREFGTPPPPPHLCLFCWGRFSGSIYIPLGLGSLQRDERSIWIQSHL